MTKYYTELLQQNPQDQMRLIHFDPDVTNRYEGDKGPWKLTLGEPGSTDNVTFYTWDEEYDCPIVLTVLYCSMGVGPAMGKRIAYLKDLASIPTSEQEHWQRYER